MVATNESTKELVGVIVAKADRQNTRKRLRGYIAMLAVDKSHRKRGIGRALVLHIVERLRRAQCDEVVLETELTNKSALALYESVGFTRDKRLVRYYLNGGDAYRLKLWFTSPTWSETVAPAPAEAQPESEAEALGAAQTEGEAREGGAETETPRESA